MTIKYLYNRLRPTVHCLLLFLSLQPLAFSQTPVFFSTKFMTGLPLNRRIVITPVNPYLFDGTNIYTGGPIIVPTTNGNAVVSLIANDYTWQVEGIPLFKKMSVPATDMLQNAGQLSGLITYTYTNKLVIVGPQGPTGSNGLDGTNGTNGTNGLNGVAGVNADTNKFVVSLGGSGTNLALCWVITSTNYTGSSFVVPKTNPFSNTNLMGTYTYTNMGPYPIWRKSTGTYCSYFYDIGDGVYQVTYNNSVIADGVPSTNFPAVINSTGEWLVSPYSTNTIRLHLSAPNTNGASTATWTTAP